MTRIGVTGHRLLAAQAGLEATVAAALVGIETHHAAPYVLVSGMAEGADEFVAHVALVRGWELEALLPLPLSDFRDDLERPDDCERLLARAARVRSIDPPRPRPDCYRAQGLALVATCDVLIALWNGEPARGPGGTAEVVAAARAATVEVVHIAAADRRDVA